MGEKAVLYFSGDSGSFEAYKFIFGSSYSFKDALSGDSGDIAVVVLDYDDMSSMKGALEAVVSFYYKSINIVVSSDFSGLGYFYRDKIFSYLMSPWDKLVLGKVLEEAVLKRSLLQERAGLLTRLECRNRGMKDVCKKLAYKDRVSNLGIMVRGFAHEVKNQLNTISYLDCIFDSLDDAGRNYVKSIYRSRDIVINLIDEIMALSSDSDVSYKLYPYSILSLVSEFVNFVKLDPVMDRISMDIEADRDYYVMINKVKIVQVLINLVRNSVYSINELNKFKGVSGSYRGSRGLKRVYGDNYINIRLLCLDNVVEVSVIDNGRGIEGSDIKKVWSSSFTTKGVAGTGVGLSLCRKIIVEGHKGDIYCFSEPNKKTVFSFTLLLADVVLGSSYSVSGVGGVGIKRGIK